LVTDSRRSGPLLLGVLSWLEEHVDQFDPFRDRREPALFGELPMVELALLCMCLTREFGASRPEAVERLLDFLLPIYRRPAFRERLFRHPEEFVSHAFLRSALRECGAIDRTPDRDEIQRVVDRDDLATITRPPHRMLELRYALDLGGVRHSLPSYATLARHSVLARPLKVPALTDAEAYVVTHVLFYVSDLGHREANGLPGSYLSNARVAVERLLGMYLNAGNWDLVGELLLSLHCLRQTGSDLYDFGLASLAAAQLPSGAVPGAHYRPEKLAALAEPERTAYLFRRCYHTTIVAGLVAALCPSSR
jgi:hypothetical protein